MNNGKLKRFTTLILALLLCLTISVKTSARAVNQNKDKKEIIKIMNRFKEGWKTKNIETIKRCFFESKVPNEELYLELFKILKSVDYEYEIIDFISTKNLAGVTCNVTRKYVIESNGKEYKKEEIEKIKYIFGRLNRKWYVAGTVKLEIPDMIIPITGENYEEFENMFNEMPEEQRSKLFIEKEGVKSIEKNELDLAPKVKKEKKYVKETLNTISKGKRKFRWNPVKGVSRYKVYITKELLSSNPDAEKIYSNEFVIFPEMSLPEGATAKLSANEVYFLNIYGYTGSNEKLSYMVFPFKYEE